MLPSYCSFKLNIPWEIKSLNSLCLSVLSWQRQVTGFLGYKAKVALCCDPVFPLTQVRAGMWCDWHFLPHTWPLMTGSWHLHQPSSQGVPSSLLKSWQHFSGIADKWLISSHKKKGFYLCFSEVSQSTSPISYSSDNFTLATLNAKTSLIMPDRVHHH